MTWCSGPQGIARRDLHTTSTLSSSLLHWCELPCCVSGTRGVILAKGPEGIMARPPEVQLERSAATARRGSCLLPPARYRHPGDTVAIRRQRNHAEKITGKPH